MEEKARHKVGVGMTHTENIGRARQNKGGGRTGCHFESQNHDTPVTVVLLTDSVSNDS